MYIYLVRHGQSAGNVHPKPGVRPKTEPLTEHGQQQAISAAETLSRAEVRPQTIYTSPYTRAVQTANIIKNRLGVPCFEDERLREYFPGEWDGLVLEKFLAKFEKIPRSDRYTFHPPGGESWLDEALRLEAVINTALDAGYESVVLVSHYDPIKAVISHLTGLKPEKWSDPKEYPPGSVTILGKVGSTWATAKFE